MIARVWVATGIPFLVPIGVEFPLVTYEYRGYRVTIRPPRASDLLVHRPDKIELNGNRAVLADLVALDFWAESFDRSAESPCDPPFDVIGEVVNNFLRVARYVGKAGTIKEVDVSRCAWRVEYLNDEGSELPDEAGSTRMKGALVRRVAWVAMDRDAWQMIHSLYPHFEPPAWHSLLLDAGEHLPSVGPAVAIAATAMEVFISTILEGLAGSSSVPPEWWEWINNRDNFLKEPSIDEKFSIMLRLLSGHSASEHPILWDSFLKLKAARNKFVHTGRAVLGKKHQVPVTTEQAQKFIEDAWKLTIAIRQWLPSEMQWPTFSQPNRAVSATLKLRDASQESRDPKQGLCVGGSEDPS